MYQKVIFIITVTIIFLLLLLLSLLFALGKQHNFQEPLTSSFLPFTGLIVGGVKLCRLWLQFVPSIRQEGVQTSPRARRTLQEESEAPALFTGISGFYVNEIYLLTVGGYVQG